MWGEEDRGVESDKAWMQLNLSTQPCSQCAKLELGSAWRSFHLCFCGLGIPSCRSPGGFCLSSMAEHVPGLRVHLPTSSAGSEMPFVHPGRSGEHWADATQANSRFSASSFKLDPSNPSNSSTRWMDYSPFSQCRNRTLFCLSKLYPLLVEKEFPRVIQPSVAASPAFHSPSYKPVFIYCCKGVQIGSMIFKNQQIWNPQLHTSLV